MTRSFRFADWPLRAKMAALLVAASLLPLSIWAYVDLRQDQVRLLNSVKDILQARGDQIVHELDAFHRAYQRSVDRIARFPDSVAHCAETPERRAAHQDAMLGLLSAYPASDTGIRGAGLIDGTGRVIIATEAPVIGMDVSDRPIVRAAMQGRAVVSDPFVSYTRSGAVPTIVYLAPMFDADRRVACVAVLWVRATALWNTVKASNALAGPDSFAVLFDRQGIRIAHTYSDEIVFHPGGKLDPATVDRLVAEGRFGARTRALLEDVRSFPEQFERARSESPDLGVFRGFAPVNQTWNYGVARRFETVPWTVFYMVPETAVTAQIAQAMRQRVLLAAGIIALAGIVGLVFSASILRPVRALRRAVTAIAGGDLAARVQDLRGDELGRFGSNFNAMAERIQAQDTVLRQSRDQLDQQVQARTAELTQTTHDLQAEIVERVRVESVLRERDAALHRAHVMTKLAHVITRPDGSFETWSETLPPLIGVEPAGMPPSTRAWMDLLHPDDRSTFRSTSIAAGVTGSRKDVEYRLLRADGAWIHVRQVIEPIPGHVDADGKMRWFSTLQDITEQKHAEEELRASEERTRLIVDTALDAVITMDSAGAITGWSPQAETMFGWTRAEALGRTLALTIIPPRYREDHRRGLEHYLATGEGPVLNKRIELSALHRDGREFAIDLSITPIRTGSVPSFSAFVRDITEQKLARVRLHSQLERLTLLDQITRAIGERQDLPSIYQVAIRSLEDRLPVDFACVCRYGAPDNSLTVIRVGLRSAPLAMALAMPENAVLPVDGNGLSQCVRGHFVHEPDLALVDFPFPQRLLQAGLRSLLAAPLQADGRVFGVLLVARREADSFSSGECEFVRQLSAHVALAARQAELHASLQGAYDELRLTQQSVLQQERLRALGEMASGIAHDINNAITPATLYAENLLEREHGLSNHGREQLRTIALALDDVAATVARMREFYRQRESQAALQPVDLNALIDDVVELTRARWHDMPQHRGAVVDLHLERMSGLPRIPGVEAELREALINVVFNAVDAMPAGGTLSMRTSAEGAEVRLEISDTGFGMDEATRARCLEPFFTTKGERGTGLGLAMVYGVAQRHDARLEIESALGQGTTVRLTFATVLGDSDAAVGKTEPCLPLAPLDILIIDDDPIILSTLRETLGRDGHRIVVASGGQAGIDLARSAVARQQPFDVVLTDLGMPYVDGRRVAGAMKELDAALPVIMMTGWGQRLVDDGETPPCVDVVLAKPPKLHALRAAIAQVIRRRVAS